MTETASTPSPADLRKFGLSTGAAFVVIFGLFLPWVFSFPIPRWPYILAAVLWAPALLAPKLLGPVFVGWMWIAHKIGAFNSRVLLTLVFFLVIAPIGFVRRLIGADPLGMRATDATTYRKISRSRPPESQERPF